MTQLSDERSETARSEPNPHIRMLYRIGFVLMILGIVGFVAVGIATGRWSAFSVASMFVLVGAMIGSAGVIIKAVRY